MVDKKKVSPTKGKKKELVIVDSHIPALLKIKYKDGGETPEVLSGLWNNRRMAQTQIDLYVSSKAPKAVEA